MLFVHIKLVFDSNSPASGPQPKATSGFLKLSQVSQIKETAILLGLLTSASQFIKDALFRYGGSFCLPWWITDGVSEWQAEHECCFTHSYDHFIEAELYSDSQN